MILQASGTMSANVMDWCCTRRGPIAQHRAKPVNDPFSEGMEGVAIESRSQPRSTAFPDACLEILASISLERYGEDSARVTAISSAKQEVGTLRQHFSLASAGTRGEGQIARNLCCSSQRVRLKR